MFRKQLGLIICLAAVGAASAADFSANFEPPDYTGDADGELLTNQQNWQLPAGSTDYTVQTYENNAYGFVANPQGGKQFAVGRSVGTAFARGQHDVDFASADVWVARYDMAALFNGTLPSAQNLGSFSVQPSTTNRSFIALNTWVDVAKADLWNASYLWYDAAGNAQAATLPGAEWGNLPVNHWYTQSTKFDFASNLILEVSITDLETGVTTTVQPDGWYMFGGKNYSQARGTAIRIFAGGALGNVMAFDNVFVPEPTSVLLIALAALGLRRSVR